MKTSFVFILIAVIPLYINNMEMPPTNADIKKIFNNTFESFGIKANNCLIESSIFYCFYAAGIPDENVHLWTGEKKYVWLSRDVSTNSHLTEFAAYCIASSVKNKNRPKSIYSFYTAMGTLLILAGLPLLWTVSEVIRSSQCSIDNAVRCNAYALGKLFASCIPLGFLVSANTIPRILDDTSTDYFEAQALTIACQKLIEQKNFKPLATYYAFAKLVKHRPLSQISQLSIIERELNNKGFSITSAYSNYDSMRAHVWQEGICVGNGEYSLPPFNTHLEVNLADFDTSAKLKIPRFNA